MFILYVVILFIAIHILSTFRNIKSTTYIYITYS